VKVFNGISNINKEQATMSKDFKLAAIALAFFWTVLIFMTLISGSRIEMRIKTMDDRLTTMMKDNKL
jgi:hypothetical protein